jgi:hypothetical protein
MSEYILGTAAHCSDGSCGVVSRTILDPASRAVTHLVILPKHHSMDGRLVPVDVVETATSEEIKLGCTLADFARFDPAVEVDLAEGDMGRLGVGMPVAGLGADMGMGYSNPVIVSHAVPLGETEVERHESVHCVDGEIGQVEGFIVSRADHQVTHVLLKEGHLWGRRQVAIPVSAVTSVDAGIRLNLTKQEVEDLPQANPADMH